jgi:hypothetical protein
MRRTSRSPVRHPAPPPRPQPHTPDDAPAHADSAHDAPPRLHTPAEAARLLTVPESWLRRQAGRRTIACTYVGKHLRFSDADLRAIINAGARTAHPLGRRADRA